MNFKNAALTIYQKNKLTKTILEPLTVYWTIQEVKEFHKFLTAKSAWSNLE